MENLMQRFESKTVVVTGGGGGIGGPTSRRFARDGARVAVFDLNLDASPASRALPSAVATCCARYAI
jgi:2-hydroxycyclohexanecarboxyl-CoA dehydrogenase